MHMALEIEWQQKVAKMSLIEEGQKVEKGFQFRQVASNSPESLKTRFDFQSLKERGSRVSVARWLLVNYRFNTEGRIRFGITLSSKIANSVVRNRIKRWLREVLRSRTDIIPSENDGVDINFVFRAADGQHHYKRLEFSEFKNSIDKAFKAIDRAAKKKS